MTGSNFNLQPGCKTTAMAIMPHTDIERALELALSLDIPFWPQLPRFSFYEDMYVQAIQNFPGIIIDPESEKISFNTAKFEKELGDYSLKMAEAETFAPSASHSLVYRRFLSRDLSGYAAIRGQVSGPVNLGFRVIDEDSRPIIYNEGVRAILFDFIQRKVNTQYRRLREKNHNAFVWLDEPGLIWAFSGFSGYNDVQTKQDYQDFLAGLDGLKALHLCSNVNLPYLLELGVELVSFDAYQIEVMPKGYSDSVATFIRNGGIISWGIVPTGPVSLNKETPETLAKLLLGYWEVVSRNAGLPIKQIAERALIAPAKCCIKSLEQSSASDDIIGCEIKGNHNLVIEEQLVETAFAHLKALSGILKDKFGL